MFLYHFWIISNDHDIISYKLLILDRNTCRCSVSSTEKVIDTQLIKAWQTIDKLSIIWNSDLTDKMKRSFFQVAVVLILLYGCTTCTLTKRLEKSYPATTQECCEQYWTSPGGNTPTKHQLYGHLPPITKTIQVRQTRPLLEKQGRAHKWCTPMDPNIWRRKSRTTTSNIHTAVHWGYGMLPWRPARSDER